MLVETQNVISKCTSVPRMISCEMVGKDSLLMVKVSPTLSTNGLHEAKNTFSSCLRKDPSCKNGILEKFRDASVTLDANSMQRLKIKKHMAPIERKNNAISFSLVSP